MPGDRRWHCCLHKKTAVLWGHITSTTTPSPLGIHKQWATEGRGNTWPPHPPHGDLGTVPHLCNSGHIPARTHHPQLMTICWRPGIALRTPQRKCFAVCLHLHVLNSCHRLRGGAISKKTQLKMQLGWGELRSQGKLHHTKYTCILRNTQKCLPPVAFQDFVSWSWSK